MKRGGWLLVLALASCGKEESSSSSSSSSSSPAVDEAAISSNERNASGSLKTICTAEADFRSNDRDNNRISDFWTGDVAGLYCIDNTNVGAATPAAIKLIEVSVALADLDPMTGLTITSPPGDNYSKGIETWGKRGAKAGYWYAMLKKDRQVDVEYARNTGGAAESRHNTSRFGVCAVPEKYGVTGRKVFIINEGNTMFWRDFGKDVVDSGKANATWDFCWPTDEELTKDWKKLD